MSGDRGAHVTAVPRDQNAHFSMIRWPGFRGNGSSLLSGIGALYGTGSPGRAVLVLVAAVMTQA
jgi:hypothetical protein